MGRSTESLTTSTRPILNTNDSSKRASHFSTSTTSDSFTMSDGPVQGDARMAELTHLTAGFDRLASPRLQQQRYVPSKEQSEMLSKLALGAKLERALGRRMSSQDAVFTTKIRTPRSPAMQAAMGEKPTAERTKSDSVLTTSG